MTDEEYGHLVSRIEVALAGGRFDSPRSIELPDGSIVTVDRQEAERMVTAMRDFYRAKRRGNLRKQRQALRMLVGIEIPT